MKRSRFSQEQVIGILKAHEADMTPSVLCRKYGISDATIYIWRKKYGGMEFSDAKRLKTLEEQNESSQKKFWAHAKLMRPAQPAVEC